MSNVTPPRTVRFGVRNQRGVATLLVTLSVLIILTIIILSSSNVALFEQKTATNENREHLAEQAAEYALNLGGEYLKANVSKISTNASGGWLNAGSLHWRSCVPVPTSETTHPCNMESNTSRRLQLYYYTSDGAVHTDGGNAALDLFATAANTAATAGTARLTTVGGTSSFPATATVYALMCRVDATSTLAQDDHCRRTPAKGRQIAITLIATSRLTGENASAVVKETWGTINKTSFAASTPLVASGAINIIGTFTIVDAPNAGGYGVPAAVWSPQDAGGNGSWQTCPLEDYLSGKPESQLLTSPGCAETHPSTCQCDAEQVSHGAPGGLEGNDMLDKDGNAGSNPDITFFPGSDSGGTRMDYREVGGVCPSDHPYCDTDDNLFEWIFGVDVTGGDNTAVQKTCTVPATFNPSNDANVTGDCEVAALSDLNFQPISDCSGLNANSSGLYYVTGTCSFPNVSQIGDPSHPVILVVDNDITFGHTDDFFGMVFVRDRLEANGATISGNASGKFFGSIVVEGGASHLNGTMDLIYMDTSAGNPDDPLPDTTRFARLPNSWLDNATGF